MKLTPVEPAEISVRVAFKITCYVCMNPLFLFDLEKIEDVVRAAGSMGWYGCQVDGKSFSTVCPTCIKTLQEEGREA